MKTTLRQIPFGKPIIEDEEKKAVLSVLEGSILVHGPKAKEFETAFAQWTKAPFALSVSSCTAALHLSYFYFELGEGDEVIVPAQTHVATVHAVELVGAKPVFVDAEIETGNIDIDQIESKITSRTKAISIVHFLGMPVNMEKIMRIAQKHNLFVVEDCALAIGSKFKGIHVGLHGDMGCFSFYPVKQMTTAEGGMLITKSQTIADKITRQKAFGVDRHVGERKLPGMYDVNMLGFNYRMNELEAAIGIHQVNRLDGFVKARRRNFDALYKGLSEIPEIHLFKSTHGDFESSYYCLSILIPESMLEYKNQIVATLNERGVGTSVYYPKPVPHFSYYQDKYGEDLKSFTVARRISDCSISLPVGPHLNEEDMAYIANAIKNTIQKFNKRSLA